MGAINERRQWTKYVRSMAEGTRTMLDAMIKMGLPAPEYDTDGYTLVTLYNNIQQRQPRFNQTEPTNLKQTKDDAELRTKL